MIESYIVALKHNKGIVRLKVASMSGKQGAITQVMAIEGCPQSAIVKIKMVRQKIIE